MVQIRKISKIFNRKKHYFLTVNFITVLWKKQGFFVDIQYKKEKEKEIKKEVDFSTSFSDKKITFSPADPEFLSAVLLRQRERGEQGARQPLLLPFSCRFQTGH